MVGEVDGIPDGIVEGIWILSEVQLDNWKGYRMDNLMEL